MKFITQNKALDLNQIGFHLIPIPGMHNQEQDKT